MKKKLSEKMIDEFINPDLDVIDGEEKDYRSDQTYVNTPREGLPVTTDDVVDQGKLSWWHLYLTGASRGTHVNINEDQIMDRTSKSDLINLYEEQILHRNLEELLKSLKRTKESKSEEQYNNILEIVYKEIKELYELERQTIQDTTANN